MRATAILTCMVLAMAVSGATAQERVRFEPEVGYPTFAVREPVLHLRPGVILESKTNMGGYYTPEGGPFPGEVGPFYAEQVGGAGSTTASGRSMARRCFAGGRCDCDFCGRR